MKKLASVCMVVLAGTMALYGCATGPSGPSDEELIGQILTGWKEAGMGQDVDKLLSFYSDDFQHYEWGDKAGLKGFLLDAKDSGYLENAEVDIDNVEMKIDGDTATVYPVEMSAAFGSTSVELTLTKEAGGWMITGMDVELY